MKTTMNCRPAGWALALLMLLLPAAAPAAVQLRGLGHSSGETVTVEIYADITVTPILSYSFTVMYDSRTLRVLTARRDDSVWYLSDGKTVVPYQAPDASVRGQVLFVGARMDGTDPQAGVLGRNVLLGWVVFERITARTPSFSLGRGHEDGYASFVTRDGAVLEVLPGEVTFEGVWPVEHDKDLDGLSDAWEVEFFKDIELAFYADDPDEDGYNNLGEEGFGTDPTDRRSHLDFSVSRPDEHRLVLEWFSTRERIYTVEFSRDLESFRPMLTGLKATPPRNTVEIKLTGEADAGFYKILLESYPLPR